MAPQAQQHAEEARNIMLRVVQSGGAQEDRKHIYRSVFITSLNPCEQSLSLRVCSIYVVYSF